MLSFLNALSFLLAFIIFPYFLFSFLILTAFEICLVSFCDSRIYLFTYFFLLFSLSFCLCSYLLTPFLLTGERGQRKTYPTYTTGFCTPKNKRSERKYWIWCNLMTIILNITTLYLDLPPRDLTPVRQWLSGST